MYARNEVYAGVRGWESFEPWLSRVETMGESVVWEVVNEIPPAWYADQDEELEKLARALIARRRDGAGIDYGVSIGNGQCVTPPHNSEASLPTPA